LRVVFGSTKLNIVNFMPRSALMMLRIPSLLQNKNRIFVLQILSLRVKKKPNSTDLEDTILTNLRPPPNVVSPSRKVLRNSTYLAHRSLKIQRKKKNKTTHHHQHAVEAEEE
jgi:hypothetical protein